MSHKHTLTAEELFCLDGCGKYAQYYKMRTGFEKEKCVFCNLDRVLNEVLWEDEYVFALKVPEKFASKNRLLHQFVIAPKSHKRFPWHLTVIENAQVWQAQLELSRMFDLEGGMLFARFGDMSLNAGTVPHIHWNLWVPNKGGEVRIPIFKDPKDRDANIRRSQGFAKLFEEGMTPEGYDEWAKKNKDILQS